MRNLGPWARFGFLRPCAAILSASNDIASFCKTRKKNEKINGDGKGERQTGNKCEQNMGK